MERRTEGPAREVLDVVPTVMRFIRSEMRGSRGLDLSVPQFRSLVLIERTPGTSLSGVADYLGLAAPTACKLIDGLAARGMVMRRESAEDRRRITLELTPAGARAVQGARGEALKSLSRLMGSLHEAELEAVAEGMAALRRVFASGAQTPAAGRSQTNGSS